MAKVLDAVTLPPDNQHGESRIASPPANDEAVPPLSWRWFVPRSRLGWAGFGAVTLLFTTIVVTFGISAAVWFGAFAAFQIVLGVVTRRMPFWGRLGRLIRADPVVGARVLDARSRPGAVGGTAIAIGVALGLILLGMLAMVT